MKTALLPLLWVAACLSAVAAPPSPPGTAAIPAAAAADPTNRLAGWIIRLAGSAEVEQGQRITVLEESKTSLFRPVHDGDRIRCRPASAPGSAAPFVEIALLWGGTLRLTNTTAPATITAPAPPAGTPPRIADALRDHLRAGRPRGEFPELILEPTDGSRLRVRDFRGILWQSDRTPSRLTVVLADSNDRVLWRRRDVEGKSEACLDPALREALATAARKSATEFVAELRDDTGQTLERARFSLLPAEDEAELEEALAWWDARSEGVVRRLGRTMVFSQHALHAAAADELDRALAEPGSAGSHGLLLAAITANERAGRPERVRELRRRLEAPPPQSDDLPAAR